MPAVEIQLTEAEILIRLNEAADTKGTTLTFSVKSFFLRILSLLEEDEDGYFLALTVKDIATSVNMPLRTVTFCLARLSTCSVLHVSKSSKPQIRRVNTYVVGTGENSRGLRKNSSADE